jgi:hypothetical protein
MAENMGETIFLFEVVIRTLIEDEPKRKDIPQRKRDIDPDSRRLEWETDRDQDRSR